MSIAVFTLALSITGISLASWQIVTHQPDINEIVTGCFDVEYTSGDNINRINGSEHPIADSVGILTDPYTFTIKNNCPAETALNVDYVVRLDIVDIDASEMIPLNRMVAYLTGDGLTIGPAVIETPLTFSPIHNIGVSGYNSTAYTLTSGTLSSGESSTYDLRLWIQAPIPQPTNFHDEVCDPGPDGRCRRKFTAKVTIVSTAATPTIE